MLASNAINKNSGNKYFKIIGMVFGINDDFEKVFTDIAKSSCTICIYRRSGNFRGGGLTTKLRHTKIFRKEYLAVGKIRGPYRTAKFSHRKKFTCEFFIKWKFPDLRYYNCAINFHLKQAKFWGHYYFVHLLKVSTTKCTAVFLVFKHLYKQ